MPISDVNHAGLQMIRADHAVEIAELCNLAGRPDQIGPFFAMRLTPDEVKNWLAAAAAGPAPASPSSSHARAQAFTVDDRLAEAIRRRFEAQNARQPKPVGQ